MRVWILLVLLVIAAGLVLWLDPFAGEGLVVHVGVVDAASGEPLSGVKVKSRFNDAWVTTDRDGMARLTNVELAPNTKPSAKAIARVLELSHRSVVASTILPEVTAGEDGAYVAVFEAESFGILTLTLEPTILPNVRLYVENAEGIRAVPVDGRGTARVGQSASYRIFGNPQRVPVVLKGDMGVGMRRWMVRAPSPGATLQRSYAATAATPISGQILEPASGNAPPLSGTLRLIPDGYPASLQSDEIEVLAPIDSVVIRSDGGFDIPHILPGAWRPIAELDYLGSTPVPEPLIASRASTGWSIQSETTTSWVRLDLPGEKPPNPRWLNYAITSADGSGTSTARVLHDADASFLILPDRAAYDIRITQPGSEDEPPREFSTRFQAQRPGPAVLEISAFTEVPFGTLVIDIPAAVSKAMKGGTLVLDTGRETSVLADLTKRIEFKHVVTGTRGIKITWRDRDMAPFETAVDVKAGERAFVVVERRRRAP